MPYDAPSPSPTGGGAGAAATEHARGALRPARLRTVRSRLKGQTLSLFVRLSDMGVLGAIALIEAMGIGSRWAFALFAVATFVAAALLRTLNIYHFSSKESLAVHLAKVLAAVGGASLTLMALARLVLVASPNIDGALVSWSLQVAAACCLSHVFWHSYVRSLKSRGLITPNLVIVGATPAAEGLIRSALRDGDVCILGIFDDRRTRSPRTILGVPVLGSTADLVGHRILPSVDRIVLAVPRNASGRIAGLVEQLAPIPNSISLLLEPSEDPDMREEPHDWILDMPLRELSGARLNAFDATIKRAMDLTIASTALVLLLPLLVAISVAVKLDSPGPVFFRQRRHGLLNEEVPVWKFRSMRTETADASAVRQVSANDDRVTRVGGFLRRTSLDELPQLWNVVRGEMSLVGPRPHAIGMLTGGEEPSRLVEVYAHRHRIKPGLTGWAAINGSRGPVDTPEAVRRRVSLDLEYIERRSLWLDLKIMFMTLPCLLGDKSVVR